MPLQIFVPGRELYNRQTNQFIEVKDANLLLEHSLVSVSKWEDKWEIPYLSRKEKTDEQVMDYIRFMTLTKNVDPNVYLCLTEENLLDIKDYIEKKHTATTISHHGKSGSNRVVTSELIYCWMIMQNIPKEFEKWPLNRLMTLIEVCSIESNPKKKRGYKETQNYYAQLNKARRAKYGSKG